MKEKDLLRKAVELYEKDRPVRDEQYEKQALNEMDIPPQYYEKAKKELARKKKIKTQFLAFGIIAVVFAGYLFFQNFVFSFPEILSVQTDFQQGKNTLLVKARLVSRTDSAYKIRYELMQPDGNVADTQVREIFRQKDAAQNLTFFTRNLENPRGMRVKFYAKLKEYGFYEREIHTGVVK
jgi:hypothetical protein